MSQSVVQLVDRLLDDRTYDIEFNGHLTNHAKHAVVALAGLGASPQRIEEYYESYPKETPYGYLLGPPGASTVTITDVPANQVAGGTEFTSRKTDLFGETYPSATLKALGISTKSKGKKK